MQKENDVIQTGVGKTPRERMSDEVRGLCNLIRQTSYEIHRYLRHGHLEKVYESALAHRPRKAGLHVLQQHPIRVFDEDGTPIGDFAADLFVEGQIIVELKAARALCDDHTAQLLGYLRASRIEHGLLCNFGGARFEIRKYALTATSSFDPEDPPTL